jgi:hypothetical protein
MALFRHVMMGTTPGEEWSCTLHTTGTNTLSSAQTAWSSAVSALWTGELDAIITPDVVVTEVSTATIDPATGKQLSRLIDDVSLPGVDAGEMLPFQCAVSVSWRTAVATRAGRGRMYLPPLAGTVLDTGRVSAAAVGDIVGAVEAFWNSLNGDGLAPVLFGRTTFTQTPITGADVGDVIDTQRRRRNKLIEVRTPVTPPA